MRVIPIIVCIASVSLSACNIGAEGGGIRITLGREAREAFAWEGRVGDGQRIEIKGVNGEVSAIEASGDEVLVSATRRGFRSDPDDVRIEVIEHDDGVTICAVYPGETNSCQPGDDGQLRAERNDVKVDFDVEVPAGVVFVARTVNGGVKAESISSDVEARTVDGSVNISTTGQARAETVNGSIRATLGASEWIGEAAFETVNGSVALALPDDVSATVSIRTSNGSIESDLPIKATRSTNRRLKGTLGDGGPELRIRTVNGSVRIREAG